MKVWSEREPGGWTECTESSYLTVMQYGGYPFGDRAYTDAERDALDAASGYPGTGNTYEYVDQGAMLRYGVGLRTVPRSSLPARLAKPGRALAIAGTFRGLRVGHPLRRWQPGFVGGHAVCVVPQGGGLVTIYDPLAPDGHPGDSTDAATVLAFAAGWGGWNPREALLGELSLEEDMAITKTVREQWDIPAGTRIYPNGPGVGAFKTLQTVNRLWSNGETEDGDWRRMEGEGPTAGQEFYIWRDSMKPVPGTRNPASGFGPPVVVAGFTQADIDEAAAAAAIAARMTALAEARAAIPAE